MVHTGGMSRNDSLIQHAGRLRWCLFLIIWIRSKWNDWDEVMYSFAEKFCFGIFALVFKNKCFVS